MMTIILNDSVHGAKAAFDTIEFFFKNKKLASTMISSQIGSELAETFGLLISNPQWDVSDSALEFVGRLCKCEVK
jgi:hypothetical protein